MAFRRTSLVDFSLSNLVYAGATVSVYGVLAGVKDTSNLVTLYDASTGTGTLANPQTLDSEGKWDVPPYIEEAVVLAITNISIGDHDTGIVYPVISDADVDAAEVARSQAQGFVSIAAHEAIAAAASAAAAAVSAATVDAEQQKLISESFGNH